MELETLINHFPVALGNRLGRAHYFFHNPPKHNPPTLPSLNLGMSVVLRSALS